MGHYDLKGRHFFYTIPFALQAAVGYKLGLAELFSRLSWPAQDALLALPTFIGLYLLGVACSSSIVD